MDRPAEAAGSGDLTHLDASGSARMVDVSEKAATRRRARAEVTVRMSPPTAAKVLAGNAPKAGKAEKAEKAEKTRRPATAGRA